MKNVNMVLNNNERIFVVEEYLKTQSFLSCQEAFEVKFPGVSIPNKSSIYRLIKKFKETGSVGNKKHNRRRTVLNEEMLVDIRVTFENSPKKSLRMLHQQKQISLFSAYKAAKLLGLTPYKIKESQKIGPNDPAARLRYCQWLKWFTRNTVCALDNLFFSDEAWFHLSGYVNSQNSRYWSARNPHQVFQQPLHSEKIGVWCAVSRKRIVGPVFFDSTLNSERYQNIIYEFVASLEDSERYCWFQQDGATCHSSKTTTVLLQDFFGDRLIGKGKYPPRSPDLTPLDYFLWGYLKSKAFRNNPNNIDQLKTNIRDLINEISRNTLKKVSRNLLKRADLCINVNGGLFEHLN